MILAGPSVLELLGSKIASYIPGFDKAAEEWAIAHDQGEILLRCRVTGFDVVEDGSEVPIQAFCTLMPRLWIVRLKVERCIIGEYPFPDLNVLTHSPSTDLDAREIGQKIALSMKRASAYPSFPWPPDKPQPALKFVDLNNLYKVNPVGIPE
jgi:hypothetical protein